MTGWGGGLEGTALQYIRSHLSFSLLPTSAESRLDTGREQPAKNTCHANMRTYLLPRRVLRARQAKRVLPNQSPVLTSQRPLTPEPLYKSAPFPCQHAHHRAHATAADPSLGRCPFDCPPRLSTPTLPHSHDHPRRPTAAPPKRASITKADAQAHASRPPVAAHGDTPRRAGSLSMTARPLA